MVAGRRADWLLIGVAVVVVGGLVLLGVASDIVAPVLAASVVAAVAAPAVSWLKRRWPVPARSALPNGVMEVDGGGRGIIFVAACAHLERQYEFVKTSGRTTTSSSEPPT